MRPAMQVKPAHEHEPVLAYYYEVWRAQRSPALIRPPDQKWIGKLCLGSLSAAVSQPCLRWAGVTHVVCVLGEFAGDGACAPEWTAAHNHRFSRISYLDWPIYLTLQRTSWREVFALLSDALASSENAVLVHCRNGKDRSCFFVYAFLRRLHGMDYASAIACVAQRIDKRGCPLFNYTSQGNELTGWMDAALGSSPEAESGILYWQRGTK